MLIGKIRKGTKSPIAKALLIFLMVALVGGFGLFSLVKRVFYGNKDGIAWVNGFAIDRFDYGRRVQKEKERIDSLFRRFGKQAELLLQLNGMESDPQKAAMNALIQEELIDQTVRAFPVYISPEYLQARLQDPYYLYSKVGHLMPSNVVNSQGRIDAAVFQQFLAQGNLGPVEQELTEDIKRSTALSLLEGATYVPQFLVKEGYLLQEAGKKYTIATYSLDAFLKAEEKKEVSDKDLKNYFDKNKKRYYTPAKRSGAKWEFEADNFNINITDKELLDYYNKVKYSRFIESHAQVKIREIVFNELKEKGLATLKQEAQLVYQEVVKDPSKFAELAKEHSKGDTAKNGGLVNFFARSESKKDKKVTQAAFRLKENDAIAPLIETKDGYVIVQRVDRKEAVFKSFDKVKKEIEKLLTDKKFASQFSRKAYNITRVKGDTAQEMFDGFVKKNDGKKSDIAPLSKGENPTANRLFSLRRSGDKLAYISEGKGYIIELKDVIKAVLPPFEMLKPYVLKDYQKEQAQKTLKRHLAEQKKTALKNKKLEGSEFGSVQTTKFLKASNQEDFKKLFEQGIPQDIVTLSKEYGVLSSMSGDKGFLIMLDETQPIDEKEFNEKESELKSSLFGNYKQLLAGSYIASLNRNATIEISDSPQKTESPYGY